MLTDQEINTYSRHIILDKIGIDGQEKLKRAKVLVIGAGGLGCPVLQYLTAAGVGTIGIIDYDEVDATNLQRQILFSINDIGKNKAQAAKDRLELLNPLVHFNVYTEKLTPLNALELFKQYQLVVDGTDNFSTRYLVNDACVITNRPLVYGAIYKFEGQVSVFNYQNGPTYRCLFPEPPAAGSVPSCSEVGVIGVLPGLIGTKQANEALKIILEIGTPLSGKLEIYDSLNASTFFVNVSKSDEQIQKSLALKSTFEQTDYDVFCGVKINSSVNEISIDELEKMVENEKLQLVDVRELWEEPKFNKSVVTNIPLNELSNQLHLIKKDIKTVVMCQKGSRSKKAIEILSAKGYKNLINLNGGLSTYKINQHE